MSQDNKFINAPEPFLPDKLPFDLNEFLSDAELMKLLIEASTAVGKYNGFLRTIVNPMLLISPLISNEAVLSSKLEGTHATLEDVLNYEAGNKIEVEQDEVQEIINYRSALFYALENISTISFSDNKLPLSNRIIKQMHSILLDNVRGSSKRPGEFKKQQNYIGNRSIVTYTPVPAEQTDEYMNNLENYIHYEDEFNILLQAAIIHAQFEMIHPFEDGNGRIGRLLIPLFLYYREELPTPTFYMSSYFESDRSLYLSHLSNISKKDDWSSWFKYFLQGIITSANESTQKAEEILALYNHMKTDVIPMLNSASGIEILDFIFQTPIFSASQMSKHIETVSIRTIYTLLNKLQDTSFIASTEAKRNKTYYCPQLLSIVDRN